MSDGAVPGPRINLTSLLIARPTAPVVMALPAAADRQIHIESSVGWRQQSVLRTMLPTGAKFVNLCQGAGILPDHS